MSICATHHTTLINQLVGRVSLPHTFLFFVYYKTRPPSPLSDDDHGYSLVERSLRTAWKASCGTWTLPMVFIRFLPLACFCSSFFFRDTSPP